MVALILADAAIEKFGDSVQELVENKRLPRRTAARFVKP